MRVALHQPDIPQNTGTIIRLCACFDVGIDIIHPAGFDLTARHLKRSALDYVAKAQLVHHDDFPSFQRNGADNGSRVVLLTTRGETPYHIFSYTSSDTLLVGRESAGVPDDVFNAVAHRVRIPMAKEMRSLNVAVALAIVLSEALRQTGGFYCSA